jgi:TP901 family phage tail tape measure protein
MAFSVSYTYLIIDKYSKKLDAIDRKTRQFTQRVVEATAAVKNLNPGLARMHRKLIATSRDFTLASQTANNFKNQTARVGGEAARFSREMNRTAEKIDKVGRKSVRTLTRLQKLKGGFRQLTAASSGIQGLFTGAALGAAAVLPVKQALTFSAVMTDVKKVVTFKKPEQFIKLKKDIMDLAEQMGRVPVEIGKVAVAGGKLGVPIEKMGEFMAIVTRTAVAFDVLEGTAGEQLASIKNKLKLTLPGVTNLMDAVNFLADNTAASGARMIQIIARVSGIMNAIKMPDKFVAAWAAFADQIEVTPQLAASGLKMMINRMKLMPGMMKKIIKDPNDAIITFLKRFEKLDPAKRAIALLKTFGPEAGRFAEAAVSNLVLLDSTMNKVSADTSFMGSMMRELAKKLESPRVKLLQISSAFSNLAIVIGDSVLPVIQIISPHITKMATAVRKFVEAHPKLTAFGVAAMFTFAAISTLVVGIGILAASITAIVGSAAAVGVIFGAIGGIVTAIGSAIVATAVAMGAPFLAAATAIIGVSEAIKQLRANWDTLFAPGFLKDLVGFVDAGVLNLLDKFKGSSVADRDTARAGTLNGRIDVTASGGATVRNAEMITSMPGDLGFNMGGVSP